MPATLPTPTYLTGDAVPDYLRGVEIVTAGMEWPASTGPVTVTMEHIADAVRAANEDPHIQVPRVRLGHSSQLNGDGPQHDPFAAVGDAEPAFGRFINLRTENDGAVLVGDVTDIPDWLADGAPSMFPNRSMECVWDVVTEGGQTYSMVITAVAFLGAYLPACRDLEDLQRLTAGGPSALAAARREESPAMPELSVSWERVRHSFNFDWCFDSESIFEYGGRSWDPWYWWARDVRLDPNEVIADDCEGGLWRIPFTTDGEDSVTFGDPVRVRETYVDVPEPSAAAAWDPGASTVYVELDADGVVIASSVASRRGQRLAASFSTAPRKNAPTAARRPSAATVRPERQETAMPEITAEQFRRLRELPEDADQDTINEALADPEAETPAGEVEETSAGGGETVETPPTAATVAAERGVTVDRDALAQLRADAAAGREARAEQLRTEREAYLTAAVRAGKFPPAARAAYASQLEQGGDVERTTREFIDALPDGTVPLDPAGDSREPDAAAMSDAAYASYMKNHHGIEVS